MSYFLYIIILTIIAVSLQVLLVQILGKINTKIMLSMQDVKQEISEKKYSYKIENEEEPFLLIKIKKEKLSFLTKIITYLEILIFSFLLVFLYFRNQTDYYEIVKVFAIVLSGWIGLKILGNFQQWSGAVFGRAIFYSFLIGTFLNIGSAVLIGWLAIVLFSNFCH